MPTDMTARQLIKQVPAMVTIDMNFTGQTATIVGEGWEVNNEYNMSFIWRGYVDMAGYTQDELTFFTQAVDIQNAMLAAGSPWNGETGVEGCIIQDIVSTRRISYVEALINHVGFLSSTSLPIPNLDIQEVVYGELRLFTPYSTDNGIWRVVQADSFGIGNPTAADRLHITRIAFPMFAGDSESLSIPSCNFIIGGVTGHEKDLVYIERLRRAYTQERS